MRLMCFRLEQSVKEMSNLSQPETVLANPESYGNSVELENFLATSSLKVGFLYFLFPLFVQIKKYHMPMIDVECAIKL